MGGREKLAKAKRNLTWTDRSMISHILLYIIVLFGIYAAVFLIMLSNSADLYSERINIIMKESFRSEKAYHISGILNSTITQAKSYFDLQAQLIQKQNTIIQELFFAGDRSHQLAWTEREMLSTAKDGASYLELFTGLDEKSIVEIIGWVVHRPKNDES